MKVSLEKVPRRPNWPLWAVTIVILWLGLAGAAAVLSGRYHHDAHPCLFRTATGLPCPTCGASRAALSVLSGHPGRALVYNPLVCAGGAVFLAWLLARLASGRQLKAEASRNEKRLAVTLLAAVILANWVYVVIRVG
jgi:hypothetical protein